MTRQYTSPLRDLILRIDAVAQSHIAYPQAADALKHLRDHLAALAFAEEVNAKNNISLREPTYVQVWNGRPHRDQKG
jgi:hypothetical protein